MIVNQARTQEHRALGHSIVDACRRYLGTEIDYLGALARDDAVCDAVSRQQPVLQLHPGCDFALDLEPIVDQLLSGRRPLAEKTTPHVPRREHSLYAESYFTGHTLPADGGGVMIR